LSANKRWVVETILRRSTGAEVPVEAQQ
jgi:hypothetical protein